MACAPLQAEAEGMLKRKPSALQQTAKRACTGDQQADAAVCAEQYVVDLDLEDETAAVPAALGAATAPAPVTGARTAAALRPRQPEPAEFSTSGSARSPRGACHGADDACRDDAASALAPGTAAGGGGAGSSPVLRSAACQPASSTDAADAAATGPAGPVKHPEPPEPTRAAAHALAPAAPGASRSAAGATGGAPATDLVPSTAVGRAALAASVEAEAASLRTTIASLPPLAALSPSACRTTLNRAQVRQSGRLPVRSLCPSRGMRARCAGSTRPVLLQALAFKAGVLFGAGQRRWRSPGVRGQLQGIPAPGLQCLRGMWWATLWGLRGAVAPREAATGACMPRSAWALGPAVIPARAGPMATGPRAGTQVAGHLVGSSATLSSLEAQLLALHAGVAGLTPAAVRNLVLELATRKSFAGKGGARGGLAASRLLWLRAVMAACIFSKSFRDTYMLKYTCATRLTHGWASVGGLGDAHPRHRLTCGHAHKHNLQMHHSRPELSEPLRQLPAGLARAQPRPRAPQTS